MNRDDMIDVLTTVAAGTSRTIGQADVKIWGSVIGHLDKQLALEAVVMHFSEKPGVWMEPGHVLINARSIIRERQLRSPIALRAKPEDAPVPAAYDAVDALAIPCPACRAPIGEFCIRADGSTRRIPCPLRIRRQADPNA